MYQWAADGETRTADWNMTLAFCMVEHHDPLMHSELYYSHSCKEAGSFSILLWVDAITSLVMLLEMESSLFLCSKLILLSLQQFHSRNNENKSLQSPVLFGKVVTLLISLLDRLQWELTLKEIALYSVWDTSSSEEISTGPIFPLWNHLLKQWGSVGRIISEKKLHIEPQQLNLSKGEKSAAHETRAFECWDSGKHTTKQEHLRTSTHTHIRIAKHTCTRTMPQGTRVTLLPTQSPCGTRTRHGMPSGVGRRVC